MSGEPEPEDGPFTPAQLLAYAKDPSACPFCGGSITGDSIEVEDGAAYQRINCDDCGRVWSDGYTLDRILADGALDFQDLPPRYDPARD